MVAMAGKYIVYLEKSRLILAHPAGRSFDLTREDAMELAILISNWHRVMGMGLCERELEVKQMGGDEETKLAESDDIKRQV